VISHFNKLGKLLNSMMDPKIGFEIKSFGTPYGGKTNWKGKKSPAYARRCTIKHYMIYVQKEQVWGYPKDFIKSGRGFFGVEDDFGKKDYIYHAKAEKLIPDFLRDYINTNVEDIITNIKEWKDRDGYHLLPYLLCSDKRIGKRRVEAVLGMLALSGYEMKNLENIQQIVELRFNK